ncbi:MAG: HEAT repeat domain-containing protein [Candidatus Brocadiia bacterium]
MSASHRALLLALGLAATAAGGEGPSMGALDDALEGVLAFEHGKDAGPLKTVEGLVVAMATDPEQREAAEQRLIQALGAAKTRDAKIFLCRQLYNIGSARCVPRLEGLLADPELSHMARYVLGRIQAPEAAAALHRALSKTSGKLQVGIINTLGDRAYGEARADIARLLGSSDPQVAEAAAVALGKLGGAPAAEALQEARGKAPERVQAAIDDALMACAEQFLADGEKARAAAIYQRFYRAEAPRHFRTGALAGLVAARGAEAAPLLVDAIRGQDPQMRASAIALVRRIEGQEATRTFARLLPSLEPQAQALLVRALGRRGDPAAREAVVAATKSEHEPVRVAALEALGGLGGSDSVDLLLDVAATGGGSEQGAARASLTRLEGKGLDAALVQGAKSGEAAVRVEAIRALAGRGAEQSLDELFALAKDQDASVRRAAIEALGRLVGQARLSDLVSLVVAPKDEGDRSALEQAVAAAFRRIPEPRQRTAPLLAALDRAGDAARPTLLRLLGRAASPEALEALRAAARSPKPQIRDAAIRSLAAWPDASAADDLLDLARTAADETHKVLALRGYIRIAGQSENPTAMYVRAMQLAQSTGDKKLVLGGLGSADSFEAMDLAARYLEDPELRDEAAMAVLQIAGRLWKQDTDRVRAAVDKVLAAVEDQRIRQQAQEVLNKTQQFEGHIRTWLVSKPYQVKGKEAKQIFDTPFPPEKPDAEDVEWKKLTRGVGQWEINLGQAVGGLSDVAAYLRTRVWSPVAQEVQLELGSDDAIKVWLNGEVVHANNTDRGVAPRQDIAKAKLAKGWNELMLKVLNHQGGWAAACRIRKPGGGAIEGLKYEAKLE